MPKITFSHNFLWVNFRRNFTFLLGLCLSIFIFNLHTAAVSAVQTPTLSVSVDNAAVNVNGNQVINSVNGTTELPLSLTINTTNKTGYTATLNTETNETALVNSGSASGAKIDSITGASSILNLPVNTWGFKTLSEINYNPIPSLATPTNIFQTTEKTNGNDVRGLNIGIKLGQNIESGSYDNKLIFSVVTNPYVGKAVMTEGPDFNTKLKALETATNKIEHFKKSTVVPTSSMNAVNIEDEESDYEIKLWLDSTDKTAYYFAETEVVYLNKDSSYMFLTRSEDTRIKNIQDIDISHFDTSMVTSMGGMFYNKPNITSLNLSSFNTSNVTDMSSMFYNMRSLVSLDLSSFNTSSVKSMRMMFYGMRNLTSLNISNFNTSKVTDMSYMFNEMTKLTSLDVSSFNTSNVTDMTYMFSELSSLSSLNLSNFNTSSVTSMHYMFNDVSNLSSLNLSNFDTSKVKYMSGMFSSMENLNSLNLSSFNTSNVVDMNSMFSGVRSLTSINLSSFNTSNVKDMRSMFSNMRNLTSLNLSSFNTSNVTDMSSMFSNMANLVLLDISNFSTSKVKYMDRMFYIHYSFNDNLGKIYVNNDFNTTELTSFSSMFENRKKLRGGNGSYLADPSTADKTWLRVDRPGVQGYFTRKP